MLLHLLKVDWRQFRSKHRRLGYKKKEVKSKWAKATDAQSFKLVKARRKGKKILVCMKKAEGAIPQTSSSWSCQARRRKVMLAKTSLGTC